MKELRRSTEARFLFLLINRLFLNHQPSFKFSNFSYFSNHGSIKKNYQKAHINQFLTNIFYLLLLKSNTVFMNKNRDLDAKNIVKIMFNSKSALNESSNHLIIGNPPKNDRLSDSHELSLIIKMKIF